MSQDTSSPNAQKDPNKDPYVVLARKYRPQDFSSLIGQEGLVRTLTNAIGSGRIAHAFMLTGVRGVGKTTTARIIAKSLNYDGPDGKGEPTTGPTDDCDTCKAIAEDRHPDVLEMDAATRTGVDDIREIIEGVRYAPTSARYKIYIIDEVHMLSKNAFNALLKTLEEPPPRVKFIFATTEIRKVPITVLSRCQRFDLKRIELPELTAHYTNILSQENVQAEDKAVSMIARAADGSVRDGLSLLDQAISMTGAGNIITADQVQSMLGLADRTRILDLLGHALKGEPDKALTITEELFAWGADPLVLLQDLLELIHLMTRYRAVPSRSSQKANMAAEEWERVEKLAIELTMPSLTRAWQIILKGLQDAGLAPHPQRAADMVIISLCYAANLPDPAALVEKLQNAASNNAAGSSAGAAQPGGNTASAYSTQSFSGSMPGTTSAASTASMATAVASAQRSAPRQDAAQEIVQESVQEAANLSSLQEIVQALQNGEQFALACQVEEYVHLVKLEPSQAGMRLEIRLEEDAPAQLAQDLGVQLKALTGQRWVVSVSNQEGAPTLVQQDHMQDQKQQKDTQQSFDRYYSDPTVQNVLKVFPGSKIVGVKDI